MVLSGRFRCGIACLIAAAVTAPLWAASAAHADAAPQGKAQTMTRDDVTKIIANSRRIVTPNGVEELVKVPINGIDQWLSIRGKDRRNPILLVLHGGPASPSMPDDYTYQSSWEH